MAAVASSKHKLTFLNLYNPKNYSGFFVESCKLTTYFNTKQYVFLILMLHFRLWISTPSFALFGPQINKRKWCVQSLEICLGRTYCLSFKIIICANDFL